MLAEHIGHFQEHSGSMHKQSSQNHINFTCVLQIISKYEENQLIMNSYVYFYSILAFENSIQVFLFLKYPRNAQEFKIACGTPQHFSQLWDHPYSLEFVILGDINIYQERLLLLYCLTSAFIKRVLVLY